jgi:hypothetical protein
VNVWHFGVIAVSITGGLVPVGLYLFIGAYGSPTPLQKVQLQYCVY